MAYLNVKDRVIEAKIVYYGAGLSGKTTNLEKVQARASDGRAGEMMALETDGDRTLFFDWLPFNVGKFNGCDVKMQLYTVPGQAKYAETRRRVLASADGVVLVLDSQAAALGRNRECVRDLRDHLQANGLSADIPLVVQLNKRDLPTAMLADVLLEETGLTGKPFVEACAAKGTGVFETLREVTRVVLEKVRTQARSRASDLKSGPDSGLDGKTLYAQIATAAPPSTPSSSSAPLANTPSPRPTSARATNGASATQAHDPPGSAMTAASPAQVNELIAAHRTLARRLDAIETGIGKNVERSLSELERRVLAKLGELAAATTEVGARVDNAGASSSAQSVALLAAIGELEKKSKEDAAQRADAMKRAFDAATRPLGAVAESSAATGSALQGLDEGMRITTTLLRDLSQGLAARGGHVDAAISALHERSQLVEGRLRELTELYAEMMTGAKKNKSWWR